MTDQTPPLDPPARISLLMGTAGVRIWWDREVPDAFKGQPIAEYARIEPGQPQIDRHAIIVAAQAWWQRKMPHSNVRGVQINGDGRVIVHWADATESGKYTLPVDFMAPGRQTLDALQPALERAWTDFLDANPDDLTSPEDLPNHALVTRDQMIDIVRNALLDVAESEQA